MPVVSPLLLAAVLALTAGAANQLTTRLLLEAPCPGGCYGDGVGRPLAAPVWATFVSFVAMALSLFQPLLVRGLFLCSVASSPPPPPASEALLAPAPAVAAPSAPRAPCLRGARARYCPLALPVLLDVFATLLQSASVLFCSAGASAAMRGSLLVFVCAALRLVGPRGGWASRGEWLGIWVSTCGAALVAGAALGDAGGGTASVGGAGARLPPAAAVALGLGLSTLSNVLQGVQVAVETAFVAGTQTGAPALATWELNGVEGAAGAALLALPLALSGAWPAGGAALRVEDARELGCCLARAPRAAALSAALCALFLVSTNAYMTLSALRGGNFRALLLVARSALVWAAELALRYCGGGSGGQPFGNFGALAVAGYAVLVGGGVLTWRHQSERERKGAEAAAEGAIN